MRVLACHGGNPPQYLVQIPGIGERDGVLHGELQPAVQALLTLQPVHSAESESMPLPEEEDHWRVPRAAVNADRFVRRVGATEAETVSPLAGTSSTAENAPQAVFRLLAGGVDGLLDAAGAADGLEALGVHSKRSAACRAHLSSSIAAVCGHATEARPHISYEAFLQLVGAARVASSSLLGESSARGDEVVATVTAVRGPARSGSSAGTPAGPGEPLGRLSRLPLDSSFWHGGPRPAATNGQRALQPQPLASLAPARAKTVSGSSSTLFPSGKQSRQQSSLEVQQQLEQQKLEQRLEQQKQTLQLQQEKLEGQRQRTRRLEEEIQVEQQDQQQKLQLQRQLQEQERQQQLREQTLQMEIQQQELEQQQLQMKRQQQQLHPQLPETSLEPAEPAALAPVALATAAAAPAAEQLVAEKPIAAEKPAVERTVAVVEPAAQQQPQKPVADVMVATSAFAGDSEGDLTLAIGDRVVITARGDDGWFDGYLEADGARTVGIFPAGFVAAAGDAAAAAAAPAGAAAGADAGAGAADGPASDVAADATALSAVPGVAATVGDVVVAELSYDIAAGGQDGDLFFGAGDRIVITGQPDEWWEGHLENDPAKKSRQFPSNYIAGRAGERMAHSCISLHREPLQLPLTNASRIQTTGRRCSRTTCRRCRGIVCGGGAGGGGVCRRHG